ncbi:putative porin, partial [Fulvivirga lutimaris]|uniref:putative porin n=1 Tax=Fulvivirga lutimaris TaxID=1819566 RepID=UPI00162753DA
MRHIGFTLLLLISVCELYGQQDSTILQKLSFTGDFRFRVEQDWDSRKSDGTYREDRSRLRYRLRFGLNYKHNDWATFGMRLRTGQIQNQQDPQITLGTGAKEFSTVPFGLEKLFFRASYEWFSGWVGKNTYPFEKQNELFWSDNVYPEGVFLSARLSSIKLNLGHFIVGSEGRGFNKDRYFQGFQVLIPTWADRLKLFPSFYYFNKMPNIPDGNDTYRLNYSIFHFGTTIKLVE